MSFPKSQIENAIRDEIAQAAAEDDSLHGKSRSGSWKPIVDSLVVLRVLCRIEEEVGLNLPESCVPPGGFDSVDQCVLVLLQESQKIWDDAKEVVL